MLGWTAWEPETKSSSWREFRRRYCRKAKSNQFEPMVSRMLRTNIRKRKRTMGIPKRRYISILAQLGNLNASPAKKSQQ